eukprot:5296676-Ditylum_brightwellii.AAC.1
MAENIFLLGGNPSTIPPRRVLISCPFLVKKTRSGWPILRAQPIVLFDLSGSVNGLTERAAEPES